MARPPRIYVEGSLYYVTLEGDRGSLLFRDDRDRQRYLQLLSWYKKLHDFKIFSFLLLSNKIFILLEPSSNITVSQIMHSLNSNYSKYFNGRYNLKGHLFRERFKAVLVEKEIYLAEFTRYIHLSPVYSGISPAPEDYLWSSYRAYLYGEEENDYTDDLVDTGDVLSCFPGSRRVQGEAYRDFVSRVKKEEIDSFKKKLSHAWIVGSREFVKKARTMAMEKKANAGRPGKNTGAGSEGIGLFAMLSLFVRSRKFIPVSFVFVLVVGLSVMKVRQKVGEMVRKEIAVERAEREKETIERVHRAKEVLKKNFEEKYRADKLSYQAMIKSLELEKKDDLDKARDAKDL